MANIRQLIENKQKLDYAELCKALILQFGVTETVNWESVLPAPQQQELFGGEVLRQIADHPQLSSQKDIRPISLKKGSVSQMLFFYVTLADSTLQKKHIENITKRFIKGTDANRYIIWFFGNKENTALKVVLSGKEGKKVVLKTLPFVTNEPYYKTYELILNLVHEKVNALFVEPTDLWKALWKAFDISIINKHFYNDIKKGFDELLTQLNKKGNPFKTEEERVQFSIRLIGRVIFCWFLKRKGILSKEVLSSDAVSSLSFGEGRGEANYYHDLLELLFFEVMNKPEKERPAGLPKIIANYPFLNGGLFDAQKNDFYTGKTNYQLNIDNKWFTHFFGNTLEKYNFTVDENSSSSAEIAIDPEMLGRIFENLLAEQNPETGESARKSTGSFYTPREIVDYMVEQSIAEHIKTYITKFTEHQVEVKEDLFGNVPLQQLTIPKEPVLKLHSTWQQEVEEFAHTAHLPNNLKEITNYIVDALNHLKVLDPACGSGAFPIGVLQKIVALKSELFQLLNPKKQLNNAAIYQLKLDTIQNSIYGIDIQPMAVELSRLRCWLSLVVDEEITNIKALPNLDFKFVCADTLIDVPEDEYVKNKCADSLNQFAIATANYFNPDHKKKKELKDTITNCLRDITKTHDIVIKSIIEQTRKEQKTASPTRLKQLEKMLLNHSNQQAIWHTYNNIFENKKVDFFNINYFFPVAKDGFDVVIGNPPYVNIENLNEKTKEYLFEHYTTCKGRTDIYVAFIEATIRFLKHSGTFSYIIPYPYTNQKYGTESRKMLVDNYYVKEIVDTSEYFVFESAMVKNIILRVKKIKSLNNNTTIKTAKSENNFLDNSFSVYNINQELFRELKDFRFETKDITQALKLKSKIWSHAIRLDEICLIAYGARLNHKTKKINKEFYVHDNYKKGYKRFTEGKNIERYQFEQFGWLDYQPDEHYNPMFAELFENNKIMFINVVKDKLRFAYDTDKFYNSHTVINCVKWDLLKDAEHTTAKRNLNEKKIATSSSFDYFFLLSILNSNIINWYFTNFLSESLHFYPDDAKELPIINVSEKNQKPLTIIVNYILVVKKEKKQLNEFVPNEHIAKQFEELIDACVYELYFENEVKSKDATVLELVTEQFKPINDLPHEQQIELIKEGYQILRNSKSEIRNRITRQKLVEEISIINGSGL